MADRGGGKASGLVPVEVPGVACGAATCGEVWKVSGAIHVMDNSRGGGRRHNCQSNPPEKLSMGSAEINHEGGLRCSDGEFISVRREV